MLIVDTLTSNVNPYEAANVRAALVNGGNMGLAVHLTSLTTKVSLSLQVMMRMPSLSFCLKQMDVDDVEQKKGITVTLLN